MVYAGICDRIQLIFTTWRGNEPSTCRYLQSLKFQVVHIADVIHKQLNWNFLYGNLWQLQIVKSSVSCLSAANDKQFWITYCTMVTNVDWWCCSQISLTKRRILELSALHEPNSIFFDIFDKRVFGFCQIFDNIIEN